MLSAGNIGFSAVGKERDQVLFSYVCVLTCIQVSVRVHVKGLRGIRALRTYLMDINIKETIINTLTTLQPASPCLSRLTYSMSKGFWKCYCK